MGSDTDPPDDIDIDQVADLVADRLEDKYSSKISRRAAIGGLLGVGGLGAMSSSASAQTTVGGGGAADAMSDHAAPHYRAKTSEIDETVTDRFVTVTSDDANLGYSAGDLVRTTGSDVELVSRGYEALEAEEGQVTNETFVRAVLSNANRDLASGSWTNLVDTKENDVRGELDDTSFHLNFDKSGVYEFVVSCRIIDGSSGDRLQIGIEDVGSESIIGSSEVRGVTNSSEGYLFGVIVIELSADTDYQVVVQNNNSSCELITNISRYTVRRSVVQS